MTSKVYRPSVGFSVLGWSLILGPVAYSAWVYHLYVHHMPWWISNSRYSHSTHLASDDEKLFWMLIPWICTPLGALVIYSAKHARALVEPEGIVLIDGWGKETLRAQWSEVTELLTRKKSNGGVNYILCAGSRRAGLGTYVNDQLLADIRERAPGLVEGDADSGATKLPYGR